MTRLGSVFDFLRLVLHRQWEPGSWKRAVTDPPWLFWADSGSGFGLASWDGHIWATVQSPLSSGHCLYVQSPKTNHLIITPQKFRGVLRAQESSSHQHTKRTHPVGSAKDAAVTREWTVQTPCISQLSCWDKYHRPRGPSAEMCHLSVWRLEAWNPVWFPLKLWGGICPRPIPWLLGAQVLPALKILPSSCVSHRHPPVCRCVQTSPFHKDVSHVGLTPPYMASSSPDHLLRPCS